MKNFLLLFFALAATLVIHARQTAPVDTLSQYTGKYKFPDSSVVTEVLVTLDSGVLMANSAMGNSELRKTEGDVFDVVAYGGTAIFKRDAENKINGVQFIVGDINIEGKKTELNYGNNEFIPSLPAKIVDPLPRPSKFFADNFFKREDLLNTGSEIFQGAFFFL